MGWTIKQITQITGISADTLRYYDKAGIVTPKRHENGYRYYDETDVMILKHVVVMKYARFSLAEIKSMAELCHREPGAECNETSKRILHVKISELKRTICNYQKTIGLMEELLHMASSTEAYLVNEERIDGFIEQIFDDIQSGALFETDMASESKGSEVQ